MTEPLISVIVPIFNTAPFLRQCVTSLLRQTYRNIEIILVDDGSTDASAAICKALVKRDARLEYYYQENGGLSTARNLGIEKSSGEYLSFVDSDDYIAPEFIETLYRACVEFRTEMAMCGRYEVFADRSVERFCSGRPVCWSSAETAGRFLRWDGIDGSVADKIFHRELFQRLRFTRNRVSEDLPVVAAVLCNIASVANVGRSLYFYRQGSGSITRGAFDARRLSSLDSAEDVRRIITARFPEEAHNARSYFCSHLMVLSWDSFYIRDKPERRKVQALLKRRIGPEMAFILFSRQFAPKAVAAALCLRLGIPGLFGLVRNIKRIAVRFAKVAG